ncbi:MAG: glycosyltransferase family 2 protein [Lachnospiraceae bacterium]|nr:glycosyltransferase family 2 protein [Lachnospiraceae bacterium]
MKKILSIIVPSYNSEAYLERCISSLLPGGEDLDIIIVDDGSKDATAEIADRLVKEHPSFIRVIHKENGGHGSCINVGIKEAKGTYYKVVDSDDRLSEEGLHAVLSYLKEVIRRNISLDMLLTNYVYDKKDAKRKFIMKPKGIPKDTMLGWDDIKHIRKYHYILMHSIIYRTEAIRECKLKLPEHTFYVDNIFAFQPLPYIKTICYKDIDLYYYYIGREGQSVAEENVIRQIDQYITVVNTMTQIYHDSKEIDSSPVCRKYMLDYLEIICSITCVFLSIDPTEDDLKKKKELWESIQKIDDQAAEELQHRVTLRLTNLPGKMGCSVSKRLYRLCSGVLGLN